MSENRLFILDLVKGPEIKERAEEICTKYGYKTPYELDFRMFYGDLKEYDIIMLPGSPVMITFNDSYILECFSGFKSPLYFQSRLRQSLDRMHFMHRTLRHPIPLAKAKALRKEAKAFINIPTPSFEDKILHSKYLDISYSVTVTDNLTGTSITIHGDNPIEIKKDAVKRLSRTIYDRDELLEVFETKEFIPEHQPTQIKIGGQDGEVRDARDY